MTDRCQVCRGRLSHHVLDAHQRVEDLQEQLELLASAAEQYALRNGPRDEKGWVEHDCLDIELQKVRLQR